MSRVFVSGCYDILHGGHIRFFKDARALGNWLTVSVASDAVLMQSKGRHPSLPLESKMAVIRALRCVDKVVPSSNLDPIFDFRDSFIGERPDILAVTDDDEYIVEKTSFCHKNGAQLVVLPKTIDDGVPISTTRILANILGQTEIPLRVDFAGGWLDVPKFSKKGGYIVNCTIQPLVTLDHWPYKIKSGLGGSAAKSIMTIRNGVRSELDLGVGWQDPAVIRESGLCVWRSGPQPTLDCKVNPDWLQGLMLLYWTGKRTTAQSLVDLPRDYDLILEASLLAKEAVEQRSLELLVRAIHLSYKAQLREGMKPLPEANADAAKYLGAGHGGYALYIFSTKAARRLLESLPETTVIEPYIK